LPLYYTPFWVIIDDDAKTLQIKYLMVKPLTVGLKNITAYSNTTLRTRGGAMYGIYVYLSNGAKILFNDMNVDNYNLIEIFLSQQNVKNLGEE